MFKNWAQKPMDLLSGIKDELKKAVSMENITLL